MALIQNPIIGRTKKTAGGMTFYTQYGKNVMRSKSFSLKDKNSADQQAVRSKLSIISGYLSAIKSYIASGFDNIPLYKTPFSLCTGSSIKACFPAPSFAFNPEYLVIGNTSGSQVENVIATMELNQICDIVWDASSTDPDELSSGINLIAFDPVTGEFLFFNNIAARSAGVAQVTFPASWVDRVVSLYIESMDYTSSKKRKPKRVVKFKAGNDLALKVK